LQSLQKYLCRAFTIPSLRKFWLLHFGQLFILITTKLIIAQMYKNYTKLTMPKIIMAVIACWLANCENYKKK
jgi:hypothetical protein